jgi:Tol biopolymer transport system component
MRLFLITALLVSGSILLAAGPPHDSTSDRPAGTIAFASLAPRGWDVYLMDVETRKTRRLTEHAALDYNATFAPDGKHITFVSERDGNMELYSIATDGNGLKRLTKDFALDDHPSWSPDGKQLAFVSTRQPAKTPGRAWNAVHVMNADGNNVRRLTPADTADYSPAWSPKGDLLAVASGSGRTGGTDLYVMKPDGSKRRLVIKDGGWPCFSSDGASLYFHGRRGGKWAVWRVGVDGTGLERVTPAGVEAYTPRASADGRWLVVAVQRGGRRQIEHIDLKTGKGTTLTSGDADHWNPAISADGRHIVYHKVTPGLVTPNVERWGTPPGTALMLVRLAGAFPAFSPDGKRLALTGGSFAKLDVMNLDGTGRKTVHTAKHRGLFSTTWAHTGDRIAFAVGPVFQGAEGDVNLFSTTPSGADTKQITAGAGNNGFPAFSPDGKQLVFRSGRDAKAKNLYIMNADGTGARRLTDGKWTDTMCDWSPAGDWIVFASDREGSGYSIWLIKPNRTGLRKLIGGGGRNNHPHFSPDGKWIVFTSQRAGYSAEEISLPRQPQPYGDLFAMRLDGTGLIRLTHNGYEEGTPAWGPVVDVKLSSEGQKTASDY